MPKRGGTGLLIRGGLVIDPAQKLEAVRDILLEDGKVKEIGVNLSARTALRAVQIRFKRSK